ncbi:MAG: Ribosomal RNA small subunit methyltransferase A [candidate division WS6 bacterium GW2011_GWD1_35_594]|uniref:Ribosomal RNA small subunit methyltransferase A n=1 Tax=candidate division WS6 bacterium GW2011_GWB1_33_6 TaxID=1619088 RepID=A0A0G0AFF4_9BACT|nr:MAG: Ribosomal RNA small subunit methyltransferase A [candidate division WS6 bacterium GW2011_GWB1_33_6]KKP82661.1 MAG: Ribosomal RNA small subunit methyltransferase A [candidate division WS6 bacterium GW2011_GWD1_35_594]OGC35880.1 MAG: ribosomal RNA small subunit methyltransferase A [candidate division WS6 bacterium RIFOXYB1_FULL_33_15]OGC37419.1 MAG: ribosomal RNA small subunit methyltransferase A [candidate division WS6 bacterium RIFOXYC1_FULL_33_9]
MKAKRSLGQNFFINNNLGEYIVEKVKTSNTKSVIEIGPGLGFFTQRLINVFENVTVIEKDSELANNLRLQFPNISVINEDFLNFDLNQIIEIPSTYFGSLPYNVSKPIVKKIVESKSFTNPAYFIIQKEVAEKYIYKKPYSTLSLTTHIYSNCKKILDISPDSFKPKPHVNSTLISFIPKEINIQNIPLLKDLITLSFRHPRKNLLNNLKGTKFQNGSQLYKTYRPSDLSLDQYIEILKYSL